MTKSNYDDYAVAAFRYYATLNRPSLAELHKILPENGNTRAEREDIKAVICTLEYLKYKPDPEIWERLMDIVYFGNMRKYGDMTARVVYACQELYISESTAWRRMAEIRRIFAVSRGLRVDGTKG